MIQKDYGSLCNLLDPKDLIICDGIFRKAIPKEKQRKVFICPWTKPKGDELPLARRGENRGILEQRGSFERHIGSLVNRFKILTKKFRHDKKHIRDVLLFIMSLHNLKEHPLLIMSALLDKNSADTYLEENNDFFG